MTQKKRKSQTQKKSLKLSRRSSRTTASLSSSSEEQVQRIIHFDHDKPFEVLGPHLEEKRVVIRAFLPRAGEAWVSPNGSDGVREKMTQIRSEGFFEAVFQNEEALFPYRIGFKDTDGYVSESEDPYSFSTEITDYDLYLISEGNHFKSYEKFGAHLKTFHEVPGVHFSVWAPNAKSVSVVGNFNHWKVGSHPMTRIGNSGLWGLFIPRLSEGEVYKYAIKSFEDHHVRLKTDPYAFQSELRPRTASVVAPIRQYQWRDGEWMKQRVSRNPYDAPLSIYEVHLGSWKRREKDGWGFLNYRELAHQLVDYVKTMGYTHIELLPVMEHPLDKSWGYQVVNYFAPSSRFGTPEDFMYFIDYCHLNGIGVILDWVPAHFPRDEYGLACFDGREIYAYQNWKKGEHKEWGTLVFDYGKNEVNNFLISNALFWLDRYHADGLRVDAVASVLYLDYSKKEGEWEPNVLGGRENLEAIQFIKKFNELVYAQHPGIITIAEESTAWGGVSRPTYLGGLGFGMKWNMGWMNDTLEYFTKDPVHRRFHQNMLTFSLLYAFSENFILPISHDEVVHGKKSLLEKMPGDDWQKFANVRLFLGFMFAHPGKKLLFMGNDFAQRDEWNSERSLDWHFLDYKPHRQINQFVKDLNSLYRAHPALHEVDFEPAGFEWIDFSDSDTTVLSFIRWSRERKELLLITCNMTPVPRQRYRVGVPKAGFYEEILNSDASEYGGSGAGNLGGVSSEPVSWHGRPHSVELNFPPLGINVFRFREG